MTAALAGGGAAITTPLPPGTVALTDSGDSVKSWPTARLDLRLLLGGQPAGEDDDPSWRERALCAQTDPEAFFPEKGGSTREAKAVCGRCPVRLQCLEAALANDERFGIWGGLSERERRRLRRFGR